MENCKYCGAPLEEGQVCGCPQAQAERAAAQQPQQPPVQQPMYTAPAAAPAAPSPVGIAFKNLLPFLKSYVKAPLNATRAALGQNDMILSVILLVIQLLVSGFALFAMLKGALNAVGVGSYVSVPFFTTFLYGLLGDVFGVAVFGLLLLAVLKIMKSGAGLKQIVIVCGANSALPTALTVLAFVFFFLYYPLGVFFFAAAMISWMVLAVPAAQMLCPESESGKFWAMTIALVAVTVMAGGWLICRVCVSGAVEAAIGSGIDSILSSMFY